jgi:hypothetical protein
LEVPTSTAACNSWRPGLPPPPPRFRAPGRRVDDVEALALDHLQRDRVLAVEARGALAVLEGQVDLGQIAQRHHPVAIGLDRQVIDVARLVEGGRDLDREGAGSVSTSPAAISWLLFCTTLISSPAVTL